MNHIITISVDVDDKTIEEKIVNIAAQEIKEGIKACNYGYGTNNKMVELITTEIHKQVKELISQKKDIILEKVTKELTNNLSKTKAAKEIKEGL